MIAVINDLKRHNGGTLPKEGVIGDCRLIVVDPPIDQIGRQSLRLGSAGRWLRLGRLSSPCKDSISARAARTAASALPRVNPRSLSRTPTAWRATAPSAPGPSPRHDNSASVRQRHREPWPGLLRPAFDAAVAATIRMAAAGGGLPAFDAPSPAMSAGVAAVDDGGAYTRVAHRGDRTTRQGVAELPRGQDFDPGGTDGHFGDNTLAATMAFQTAHGLKADGVAGQQTFNAAIALGFQLIEEPDTDNTGSNFPPRPNFASLQSTRQRWALFGRFDYVPAPVHGNPERIRILGSWVADNLVDVPIPQLARTGISSAPATIRFHRLASAQLQALWAAWESANLLGLILTYDGSFVPRFKRGQANGGDEALSNHSFEPLAKLQ